jgi:hypothetical protein
MPETGVDVEHARLGEALIQFVDAVELDLVRAPETGEHGEAELPEGFLLLLAGRDHLLEGWILDILGGASKRDALRGGLGVAPHVGVAKILEVFVDGTNLLVIVVLDKSQ